jgi:V/A-type H+/Na+-transporting ATPase subunit I
MYGMMFGDVGDGAVILVLGFLLSRRKSGFLGFSAHSMKSLGTIMVISGLSAMVFGVFYGSVFLTHSLFRPLLFEPISAFGTIIEVALAFGVAQLAISLVLNIANKARAGDWMEAVFSGKGLAGLCYYLLGVLLAVRIIQGGLQLSLFYSPADLPITGSALLCLLLVLLSPLLRHLLAGDRLVGGYVIEGVGELLEVFISFLTNSLSYVRLAAFALAHSIFAGFASDLGSTMGLVASLVLVNGLVISVDGFAAGIQSVRLLYYEFSTKFFTASGQRFKPLTLKLTEAS